MYPARHRGNDACPVNSDFKITSPREKSKSLFKMKHTTVYLNLSLSLSPFRHLTVPHRLFTYLRDYFGMLRLPFEHTFHLKSHLTDILLM